MAGFLDPRAPSIEAEYTRYLDADILGKIAFKNFCRNVLSLPDSQMYIPLGRWGDADALPKPRADVVITDCGRDLDVEIKFVKVNIANRSLGRTRKNWAFGRLLTTPHGDSKRFDIAVCMGVMLLGLEDPRYWDELDAYEGKMRTKDIVVNPRSLPHEPAFLGMCGLFIMPFQSVRTNQFRVTIGGVEKNKYHDFFAWGHQDERCRELWASAVANSRRA